MYIINLIHMAGGSGLTGQGSIAPNFSNTAASGQEGIRLNTGEFIPIQFTDAVNVSQRSQLLQAFGWIAEIDPGIIRDLNATQTGIRINVADMPSPTPNAHRIAEYNGVDNTITLSSSYLQQILDAPLNNPSLAPSAREVVLTTLYGTLANELYHAENFDVRVDGLQSAFNRNHRPDFVAVEMADELGSTRAQYATIANLLEQGIITPSRIAELGASDTLFYSLQNYATTERQMPGRHPTAIALEAADAYFNGPFGASVERRSLNLFDENYNAAIADGLTPPPGIR